MPMSIRWWRCCWAGLLAGEQLTLTIVGGMVVIPGGAWPWCEPPASLPGLSKRTNSRQPCPDPGVKPVAAQQRREKTGSSTAIAGLRENN